MNKENKILITGATGFVGSNLTAYLQKNKCATIGITRNPKTKEEINYSALNDKMWNTSFAMIHLAGKAHDLKGVANENDYFEVNTELTKTLFQQFLESTCKVFIYMSSVKAVADTVVTTLTEDVEPTPETAYGKSKLAAEQYLLSQKLPKGKFLYILRPCMIHGPGNKGNLNSLFAMANKGIPYPFGAYDNQRSFLSIDNLSFIIKELLVQKPISGIYNICDDEFLSTTELYVSMGKVLGKKLKVLKAPKVIVKIFGKFGDYLPFPINSEKIQKLTENYRVSNVKIKKALHIAKMPLSAKNGIIKTIKSFHKNR